MPIKGTLQSRRDGIIVENASDDKNPAVRKCFPDCKKLVFAGTGGMLLSMNQTHKATYHACLLTKSRLSHWLIHMQQNQSTTY
jgi:hypothetical protein